MKQSILKFLATNFSLFFDMCECDTNRSMDLKTPRNVYLSPFYKRSFAYYTVRTRMPVILTSLVDNLARNKSKIVEEYGEEAREELKTVIGEISEFKYEIQTNKPLKNLTSEALDAEIYNDYIAKQSNELGPPSYFHTIWLLSECYMYRRVRQTFEKTASLTNFDPFRMQKEETYASNLPIINQMGQHIFSILNNTSDAKKDEFISLIKLNLWGNKCDLSLSLGKVKDMSTLFDTAALDSNILSDHSEQIWKAVTDLNSTSQIIDIVFDNSGYELFTDLCLADYIISKNLAQSIRLHVKAIPWFISDVMTHDFHWTIEQLKKNENPTLQELGNRWSDYVQNETWSVVENNFWTLPYEYAYMAKVDPNLYRELAESKLIFFKGDLNYRKLFGEKNWDPTTSVDDALQNFNPTTLCILRTLKSDIVCGLKEGVVEKAEAQDPNWLTSGEWGVIQFSAKIVTIN